MKPELIFVTGFFGSPIIQTARSLAAEKSFKFVSLDDEIEKADGRSVKRICMLMGEHEYRNKEYEAIKRLTETVDLSEGIVIACGDGVLLDDMSKELILKHRLVITGTDMNRDELWKSARTANESCHAFMHFGTDEDRRTAFERLYEKQRKFFAEYIA